MNHAPSRRCQRSRPGGACRSPAGAAGKRHAEKKFTEKRVAKAAEELEYEKYFDYVLVNDTLSDSLSEAEALIEKNIAGNR